MENGAMKAMSADIQREAHEWRQELSLYRYVSSSTHMHRKSCL